MLREPVKPPGSLTRRDVLRAAAAAGTAAFVARAAAFAPVPPPPDSAPTSRPAAAPAERPWWLSAQPRRSRVAEITSDEVFEQQMVNPAVLRRMLDAGLAAAVGLPTAAAAWRQVLGPAQRILLKFNHVGGSVIGTNEALAQAMAASLADAGYAAERLVLAEVPSPTTSAAGARRPVPGWGGGLPLGEATEEMAAAFLEADAAISVGQLKTHGLAGMSGVMKNLAYGIIRRPGRYHANGCSPFVGQIIGHTEVSRRLRLCVLSALRVLVRGGPEAFEDDLYPSRTLLFGIDPVAVDVVGLDHLLFARRKVGETDPVRVPHLAAAAAAGIGRGDSLDIERVAVADPGHVAG